MRWLLIPLLAAMMTAPLSAGTTAPTVAATCTAAPAGTSTAQTLSCTVSSGQVVIVAVYLKSTSQAITAPTGFTQFDSKANTSSELVHFWHVVGSGDSGSYAFTWGATALYSHVNGWVVAGADTSGPIDAFGNVSVTSTATATTPSETPTGTDLPLADFAQNNSNATPTITSGWTSDYAGGGTAGIYLESQHGPAVTAATTATITYTSAPASGILGEIVLVKSAASLPNGLSATHAGGPHQSVVVADSLPPIPHTMVWFDEYGNNQNVTPTQQSQFLDQCNGADFGTGTTTASVLNCPQSFVYADFTDGTATKASGHEVNLPWHVGLTQSAGVGTCPSQALGATEFWASTAPDWSSTGSSNWFVFDGTIGTASKQVVAAEEFSSPATYVFFLNLNSTTLRTYVKNVLDNCAYQGDALNSFTGFFADNVLYGIQQYGMTPYGSSGLTNFKNIGSVTGSPTGNYAYANCNGGGAALFNGTFCLSTTQLNASDNGTTTYPGANDYATAFNNFFPTVTHYNGSAFNIVYNGLVSGYQSKNLNQVSNIQQGVNEHAVTQNGSSEGVPQTDKIIWQLLNTCSDNAAWSPSVQMGMLDDAPSTSTSRSPLGSAAHQQDLRLHYGVLWACRPDTAPQMMVSWLNYCGDQISTYNCVDVWPGDFATPSGRINAYQSAANDGAGNPCGESASNNFGTGAACTAGGVRDPNIQATCGTVTSTNVPCLFIFEWTHFYVWNTSACSYNRSTWNGTCLKDIGPLVELANFSNGSTYTLSAANLQTWLGTTLYNQMTYVGAFCTPSGYFNTTGSLYPTGTTSVCSGGSGDVANGGVLDFSTALSSILGTTLPDQDVVFLSHSH